jgi:hypothetical protein
MEGKEAFHLAECTVIPVDAYEIANPEVVIGAANKVVNPIAAERVCIVGVAAECFEVFAIEPIDAI